jgi:hypothetical protein
MPQVCCSITTMLLDFAQASAVGSLLLRLARAL